MATHSGSGFSHEAFTHDELTVLGLFYAGARAHVLREQYQLDPWRLVNRHRQLPREEHARVRELADRAEEQARAAAGRFA